MIGQICVRGKEKHQGYAMSTVSIKGARLVHVREAVGCLELMAQESKTKSQAVQWCVWLPPMARAKGTNMWTKGKLQLLASAPTPWPHRSPAASRSPGRKSKWVNEAHGPQSTCAEGQGRW